MTGTVFLCAASAADQQLADALARALPRLGRRGAVRVLREGDPSDAQWFLLLASPEAAQDPDVDSAIRRRLAVVGSERLQVVVTSGTWSWDASAGELSAASTAAPDCLRRGFRAEPRHLQYRGRRDGAPSPRDPVFREQVAEIVAPILGTTKDDLAGEDVRRRRRTRALTRAGAGALAALLVLAAIGGVIAVRSTATAERARIEAAQERDDADSRRLAALAGQVASTDGALQRLLAVEAWRTSRTAQAGEALAHAAEVTGDWSTTTSSDEVTRLLGHASYPVDLELSATHVASIDVASVLRIWPLGETSSPITVESVFGLGDLAWSHDGSTLAAAGGRVHLFDPDGEPLGFAGPRSPARLVGPWGETGFVAGGDSIALVQDRAVLVERPVEELDFTAPAVFVQGSRDGERILAASAAGEVALLDADLEPLGRWTFLVVVDQFGERDSLRALAWDGQDRLVLPPDNDTIRGPVLGVDGTPDGQDGAIAGIYDVRTGTALEPLRSDGYLPLPATSAVFLPDGSALALTPGGLESSPAFGATAGAPALSGIPLPARAELLRASPDGYWIAVSGHSAEANLVRIAAPIAVEGEDPVARACAAAGRNLSDTEWATYLPGRTYRATCEAFGTP